MVKEDFQREYPGQDKRVCYFPILREIGWRFMQLSYENTRVSQVVEGRILRRLLSWALNAGTQGERDAFERLAEPAHFVHDVGDSRYTFRQTASVSLGMGAPAQDPV